jgi:phage tail sheath gpL-like
MPTVGITWVGVSVAITVGGSEVGLAVATGGWADGLAGWVVAMTSAEPGAVGVPASAASKAALVVVASKKSAAWVNETSAEGVEANNPQALRVGTPSKMMVTSRSKFFFMATSFRVKPNLTAISHRR